MTNKESLLTAEMLRQELNYCPDTGAFKWTRRGRGRRASLEAGHVDQLGYVVIRLNGRSYLAHRLAWLHVHGEWPAEMVDHINGQRADNRIANLRPATCAINAQNLKGPTAHNKTGLMGVGYKAGALTNRYTACISINGRSKRLGCFPTADAAHAVYLEAKRRLHEGCTI
ncbi:hypothetical protein D3C87_1238180 [compost metagenome]